jgi:DNA excision repair protein ERCC-2
MSDQQDEDISRMLDQLAAIKGEEGDASATAADASPEHRDSAPEHRDPVPGTRDGAPEVVPNEDGEATDWRTYFPFEEPYPSQREGIEGVVETGREGGYSVVEGACGSGKTLLALLAGISLVRDPDTNYERVFVVTSVKQQLQQFEADLRAINAALPGTVEPVEAITLVGKTDMCPYVREPRSDVTRENVSGRCSDVREATSKAMESTPAEQIASRAQTSRNRLETDGTTAPYPKTLPDDGTCPFYAGYKALDSDDYPFGFEDAESGVLDPPTIRRLSTDAGVCPHSMMAAVHDDAEVVVGNFYHAYSRAARAITGPIIDDSTFLVVDEAHSLESRVRDLFETSISVQRIETAIDEIDQVLADVASDRPTAEINRLELEEHGASVEALEGTKEFLEWIRDRVDARVSATLEKRAGDWRENWADLPEEIEIQLREPRHPQPDEISRWAGEVGFEERDWLGVEPVGYAVEDYLTPDEGPTDITVALPAVGTALKRWYECDHENFFREIVLRKSNAPGISRFDWQDAYTARLLLVNCLPTEEIAETLDEFGGGVLMSATLAPLDVFEAVVGLDDLDREVAERQYPLRFPEENRASFVVRATQFTRKNRNTEAVRAEYADTIAAVARSPGNVLVVMPSYSEAEWAASVLDDDPSVPKPVLVDESSDNDTTSRLKERFFAGDGKVLVTSARGTLTEGVDYEGEKLSAAVVCGVPFVKLGPQARAIETAYDRHFDGDGFDFALSVPAVRKARQALGRVIRGPEEVGVRVLVDERYASTGRWNSAGQFLADHERREFERVTPGELPDRLDEFWNRR